MQLNAARLETELNARLAPVWLISSAEPLLLAEASKTVRERCLREGYERQKFDVQKPFDWSVVRDTIANRRLFAEKKLIELHFATLPDNVFTTPLRMIIESVTSDCVLLICCSKLKPADMYSPWVQTVDRKGVVLRIWPPEPSQWLQWLEGRLRKADLRIQSEALKILAYRVEGNLLAAAQEIEKLSLFCENDVVDTDCVLSTVADNPHYELFSLIEYALAGDVPNCVHILRRLRAEETPPMRILAALNRELRLLGRTAIQRQRGGSVIEALRSQQVWPKRRIPLLQKALQRHGLRQIEKMLADAGDADRAIKGDRCHAVWGQLSCLTLQLAGVRKLTVAA